MTDREALLKIWYIMFQNDAHNAILDANKPEVIKVMGEKLDDVQDTLVEWGTSTDLKQGTRLNKDGGKGHPYLHLVKKSD